MTERRGGMRHRRPRLTRSADFDRVYRRGRSAATRTFVLYAFPSAATRTSRTRRRESSVRLGVSVGRRVGGAVERNRVKRMLREAFWALDDRLPAGHDFVIVARAGAAELADEAGLDGVRDELAELLGRLEAPAPERRMAAVIAVRALTAPIRLYQRVISPALPRRCKYEPTCSAYAAEAIRTYGPLRGVVLAVWRVLRCNPFSHGGYDPVSEQRLFR